MVKKYVKKPVVVEAVQFRDYVLTPDIRAFLEGTGVDLKIDVATRSVDFGLPYGQPFGASLQKNGQTLDLRPGDFIVKGVDGSIYPVHEETFWKVYGEYKEEEKMDVVSW